MTARGSNNKLNREGYNSYVLISVLWDIISQLRNDIETCKCLLFIICDNNKLNREGYTSHVLISVLSDITTKK